MRTLLTFLLFAQALPGQTWLQLNDLPDLGRDDGVAVTVNTTAFFGSGLRSDWSYGPDFYALDPVTNNWTTLAPMPIWTQRQYACAFAGPGSFFVFGGDGLGGPLNDLFKYDIASNSWSAAAARPGSGVFGAACLEFGDKIIIIGGKFQGSGPANSEVWEYTISTNSWQQKNNFPGGGRFRASAAVYNNTGYLMFGIDENNLFKKSMYSYNSASDSWTALPDFPQTLGRAYSALKAIDNKLILFGGLDSLNTYHKDVWYFNPSTTSWSQDVDFPSFGRKGGMSAVVGNTFYYSCGINVSDARLKETWKLDLPVGLREQTQDKNVSLFPNPFRDVLFFKSELPTGAQLRFDLVDSYGRQLESISKKNDAVLSLSTGHLNAGLYFIKIYSEEKLVTVKRLVKD